MSNLRHWSALGKTDPRHTKQFQRAGGFRGTATKPIWTEYRLTEHFGPCGVGWGFDEPKFQVVPAADELLVFCTVSCWYRDGEQTATVYGVGGDKVLVKQSSGLRTDDEAFKKAFTDAIGNAFKHVGAGADVHMGLFEDSKYVAEVKREFAEEEASAKPDSTDRAMLPPHPEEPPEAEEARAEFKRMIRLFREATTPEAITDDRRGIWAKHKETVAKIIKFGGDAALAKMNEASQARLDELQAFPS